MYVLLMMLFVTGCHTGTLSFETSLASCCACYNIFNIFVPSGMCTLLFHMCSFKFHTCGLLFSNFQAGHHAGKLCLLYILFCTLGHSGIVLHIFVYFTFIWFFKLSVIVKQKKMPERNIYSNKELFHVTVCLLFLCNALEIFQFQGSVCASDIDVLSSGNEVCSSLGCLCI